jgi:hypothetical protein
MKLLVSLGLAVCATILAVAQDDPNRQLVQTEATRSNARRVALVIGNGAYTNAPGLKNPPNDARDMAATLASLGFDVSRGVNVNQREMKRLIREFGQKLKAGGHGLFYYAGHGVQARGRNYIIPVDAEILSEADVEDSGVDVGLVLNYMDDAQNGLNIVILDACRNNPFARSFRSASDGLAQVDAPTGTLIAYATAPGKVAADGAGDNGLYTSELLKAMRVPGLMATDMFMQVRAEVMKRTGNKQVPWEASSLVGSFYFSGGATAVLSNSSTGEATPTGTRFDAAAFEFNYWDSIKNSNIADDFKAYLTRYPNGQFSELAKNRIKSLEAATKPVEPVPVSGDGGATEVAFWDYIKNSTNVEDFQAYIKRYPNGAFADLANNRVKALEAAIREKEKEEEAKRIALEAATPIKIFKYSGIYKGGMLIGDHAAPWILRVFQTRFEVRPDTKDELTDVQKKDWEQTWTCDAFKRAKVNGLEIREIRAGWNYRFRFETAAEATEALGEIQRICKTNAQR